MPVMEELVAQAIKLPQTQDFWFKSRHVEKELWTNLLSSKELSLNGGKGIPELQIMEELRNLLFILKKKIVCEGMYSITFLYHIQFLLHFKVVENFGGGQKSPIHLCSMSQVSMLSEYSSRQKDAVGACDLYLYCLCLASGAWSFMVVLVVLCSTIVIVASIP